jgi:zinc/manganese transport system substrate-binding protein
MDIIDPLSFLSGLGVAVSRGIAMIRKLLALLLCLGMGCAATAHAEGNAGPLRVVASTTDLGAIAKEVGGSRVSVQVICGANQEPHEFEFVPGQVRIVQQADIYLKVGRDLDKWADKLIESSGNTKLLVVDCSQVVTILPGYDEVAHPLGNPHYWLGPSKWDNIAGHVAGMFSKLDSAHTTEYDSLNAIFEFHLRDATAQWKARLDSCRGFGIVSEHAAWNYFAADFRLSIIGTVSRIPEVEPTPQDLAQLEMMIRQVPCVYLREPFESERMATVLQLDTGVPVIVVPTSVGGVPQSKDLWSHMDYLVNSVAQACERRRFSGRE